jgi:hypothetical protein
VGTCTYTATAAAAHSEAAAAELLLLDHHEQHTCRHKAEGGERGYWLQRFVSAVTVSESEIRCSIAAEKTLSVGSDTHHIQKDSASLRLRSNTLHTSNCTSFYPTCTLKAGHCLSGFILHASFPLLLCIVSAVVSCSLAPNDVAATFIDSIASMKRDHLTAKACIAIT